jgi:hypothetical protein
LISLAASSAAACGPLGPFAFDDRAHFIRNVVDALDFEHVLTQPLEIGLHHDLVAD